MKRIAVLLALFIHLGGCSLFLATRRSETADHPTPDRYNGCSAYRGWERQKCINMQSQTLENILNGRLVIKVLQTERESLSPYARDLFRECILPPRGAGDDPIRCWEYWTEKQYRPTFWHRLGEAVSIGAVSAAAGYLGGARGAVWLFRLLW